MPKATFMNLKEEKQRRIFDAAVQEFSIRRFSEASINQIVKTAGIPRGSFYQYFTGKEDVFSYVFSEIARQKREIVMRDASIDPGADFFEIFLQVTKATYDWGRDNPEYSQLCMLMEIDTSEFIERLRADSTKGAREAIERDKQRGYIKSEIDSDLIVDIIYALNLSEFFRTRSDSRLFMQRVNDVIKVVREGIAVV